MTKTKTINYSLMITIGKRTRSIPSRWFSVNGGSYETLKNARAALKRCQKHRDNKNYSMWIEKVTIIIEEV
ncbi:hypothetical protein LCGC14_2531980 [marine sediment metagenome]|uniref:Uncharacterized protein n=1 Tax=marine sediment metagenome TaxID=412755 RepID=A0A0F9ATA3_9ZZZZ